MTTTPDPQAAHSGARYPDTAWGRIRAYLDNATTVLSRVDLGELLAENVQLKRRLEWPDEQSQDDGDVRAVADWLAADSEDMSPDYWAATRAVVRARFADRIAALEARDATAAACERGAELAEHAEEER